jgi:hypothetical protein
MEIGERPLSPASPKHILRRPSIFYVRNDYRMNESKGRTISAQGSNPQKRW